MRKKIIKLAEQMIEIQAELDALKTESDKP